MVVTCTPDVPEKKKSVDTEVEYIVDLLLLGIIYEPPHVPEATSYAGVYRTRDCWIHTIFSRTRTNSDPMRDNPASKIHERNALN